MGPVVKHVSSSGGTSWVRVAPAGSRNTSNSCTGCTVRKGPWWDPTVPANTRTSTPPPAAHTGSCAGPSVPYRGSRQGAPGSVAGFGARGFESLGPFVGVQREALWSS